MPEPKDKNAPDKETKKQDEVESGEEAEKTIGEELGEDEPAEPEELETEPEAEPKVVPESALLKERGKRKKLEKDLKELKAKLESGESDEDETTDEVAALAKEYDVDPKFLRKLAGLVAPKSAKEPSTDTATSKRLAALEEDKKQERIDKAFTKGFNKAMENLSDFKDIVNPEVIKALSLLPKNGDKTFTQLIEETYGKALGGKRTIEPTRPRGGKEPEEIDYAKAQKDTKYFAEIMADPDRKKEYNKNLEKRLGTAL